MVSSLPLEELIKGNTEIPKAIDYACGAGHFLNEYASQIREFVIRYKGKELLSDYYKNIYGIEKEYRLSKVSKVSSFMYGQDGIKIVYGDALVPHEAIKDGEFKVLIANPPYSVTGFLATLSKEQRDAYVLSADVDSRQLETNNSIETFFIERAKQLLAPDGVAAIILPSSILSNSSNIYVKTREILLQYFDFIAIAEFGKTDNAFNAAICIEDAPIYIMKTEGDGSITGELVQGDISLDTTKAKLTVAGVSAAANVMVDYYVDLPGTQVYEADITPDTFSGYYYVEADTLFRDQATGKDMPANLTFPNVKIQSNFTMTFAGTGDPSTFAFTMDAFPGYTYFDKSKKVLCVLQVAADAALAAAGRGKPVMPHTAVLEHNAADDIVDLTKDSAENFPQA